MQLFQIIRLCVLLTGSFFKGIYGQRFNLGLAPANLRIINGYNIDIRKTPWQVSLHYHVKWWKYYFNCGGVIIGRREVLTAAHCFFFNKNPSYYRIRAGSTTKSLGGTLHNLLAIKTHPAHILTTCQSEHDLAFVRVKEAFQFGAYIKPIPLAEIDPQDGDNVIVAGWGISIPETQTQPEYLQAANFTVLHRYECLPEESPLQDDIFCLRSIRPGGSEFLCSGDSGGPVVKDNELIGIISGIAPKFYKPPDEPCRPITQDDLASMIPMLGKICNPATGTSIYTSTVPHKWWIRMMMRQKTSGG